MKTARICIIRSVVWQNGAARNPRERINTCSTLHTKRILHNAHCRWIANIFFMTSTPRKATHFLNWRLCRENDASTHAQHELSCISAHIAVTVMRGSGEGFEVIILYCGCWNVTTVLTKLFAHNKCCNAYFTWVLLCWVSSPAAPAAPWPGRSTPPDIRSITCRWHIKILQTLTKYKIAQGKVRAPQTPGNLKEGLQPWCLLFFRLWPSDSQHNKRLNILCLPTLSCH